MTDLVLHRAKSIIGWMSDAELEVLAKFAKESKSIFEIGCYFGRSTRALLDNTSGKVHAIDSWDVQNYVGNGNPAYDSNMITYNVFICNLYDHYKSGKLVIHPYNWEDFIPKCQSDFIFIDGDHKYEAVKRDIRKAFEYLKAGGILAGHDFDWPGVQKAVGEEVGEVFVKGSIWWKRY